MTDFKELREALDADQAAYPHIATFNAPKSTIRSLLAELDAARTTLAHIAAIAHAGWLAKLNEHGALCNIRRLSIPYWDCSGNQAAAVKRVDAAIDAMKEQQ